MFQAINELHEGFEKVLISKCVGLRARLNRLRPDLRKWLKDPGVLFYPSMNKWAAKYEVGSGSFLGEVSPPLREIYSELVNSFRDDHWDVDQKSYVIVKKVNDLGEMDELKLDASHLIQYNELRHSLTLLTKLSDPDKRSTTKVVSVAHV